MIRLNLYVTKKQMEALRELAKNGIKVSEHIRRAIDLYLSITKEDKNA